tara:strand:- start:130 stop:2601 length:2472 start_codon:yes stop_codon:yes gene_type:complete
MPIPDPLVDGDSGFSGVNSRLDAGQLPRGFVSSAKNIRFKNGVASPRAGIKKVYWGNDTLTNVGATDSTTHQGDALFGIDGDARTVRNKPLTAFSNIRGIGRFDNPNNGVSWLLIATSTTIYGIRENNDIIKIQTGLTIPENVEFVQCFNVVIMFRGEGSTPLVMENRADGFHEITSAITQFTFSGAATANSKITLISTNQTSKTYKAKTSGDTGTLDGSDVIFRVGFTNATCDYNNATTIEHDADVQIVAGLHVTGTGIPAGATIASITDSTEFELSTATTGGPEVNETLTFSNVSDTATNLKTAIESVNGHNGQLLVTVDAGKVVIAQSQPGDAGKTAITTASSFTNSTNPNPSVAFTGGQEASDVGIDENDADGTEAIPNADTGLYFQNRLMIPHNRDLVAVSDYLNYTRYQPVMSNFRINQGSEDKLVALVKFDQSTVVCFKEHSVYAVRNIYGNLADTFLDELTRTSGLIGKKAVTTVGKDIWYLSDQRGVVSLSVSESGKLQGLDVPISEPIQPLIDRINWKAAPNAVAAYHQSRYYLAVPIDGAAKNNAVLVYDFKNQAWSGYDQSDQIGKAGSCSTAAYENERTCVLGSGTWTAETGILDMFTFSYLGAERLFFLTTDGFLSLYDDGMYSGDADEGVNTSITNARNITHTNISTELISRGYSFENTDFKTFSQADFQLATNGVVGATGITLIAQFDGVSETQSVLTNTNGTTKYINFSRTKYDKPFDKADFVETNAGDDYMTKFRQDYSTDLSTALNPNTTGFDPDVKQESTQKARFNGQGRFVQFKVANDLGLCEVKGIKTTALPGKTMVTKRI